MVLSTLANNRETYDGPPASYWLPDRHEERLLDGISTLCLPARLTMGHTALILPGCLDCLEENKAIRETYLYSRKGWLNGISTLGFPSDRLTNVQTLNRIRDCLMALVPYIFQVPTVRLTSTQGGGSLMALARWVFRVTANETYQWLELESEW